MFFDICGLEELAMVIRFYCFTHGAYHLNKFKLSVYFELKGYNDPLGNTRSVKGASIYFLVLKA